MKLVKIMKNTRMILSVIALTIVSAFAVSAQTLTSLDGESINLEGQNGKVVVLAVGASWLPLSKDQVVIANKLVRKYAGRDVLIYFVATDSTNAKSKNYASDEQIKAFASRNKLGVPVLRDSDGLLTLKKFSIDQLPSFVILDKSGKMSGSAFGGIDPEADLSVPLSKAIDKLL